MSASEDEDETTTSSGTIGDTGMTASEFRQERERQERVREARQERRQRDRRPSGGSPSERRSALADTDAPRDGGSARTPSDIRDRDRSGGSGGGGGGGRSSPTDRRPEQPNDQRPEQEPQTTAAQPREGPRARQLRPGETGGVTPGDPGVRTGRTAQPRRSRRERQRAVVREEVIRDTDVARFDPSEDIREEFAGGFVATVETDAGEIETRRFAFTETARERFRERAREQFEAEVAAEYGLEPSELETRVEGDRFVAEPTAAASFDERRSALADVGSDRAPLVAREATDVSEAEARDSALADTGSGRSPQAAPRPSREAEAAEDRDSALAESERGREIPEETASDIERQLEEQVGTDLDRGTDFTVERTDEGFVGRLTETGEREFRVEQQDLVQLTEGTPLESVFRRGAEVGVGLRMAAEERRERFLLDEETITGPIEEAISGARGRPEDVAGITETAGTVRVPFDPDVGPRAAGAAVAEIERVGEEFVESELVQTPKRDLLAIAEGADRLASELEERGAVGDVAAITETAGTTELLGAREEAEAVAGAVGAEFERVGRELVESNLVQEPARGVAALGSGTVRETTRVGSELAESELVQQPKRDVEILAEAVRDAEAREPIDIGPVTETATGRPAEFDAGEFDLDARDLAAAGLVGVATPEPISTAAGAGVLGVTGVAAGAEVVRREGAVPTAAQTPAGQTAIAAASTIDRLTRPGPVPEIEVPEERPESFTPSEIEAPESRRPYAPSEVDAPTSREPVAPSEIEAPESPEEFSPDEIEVPDRPPGETHAPPGRITTEPLSVGRQRRRERDDDLDVITGEEIAGRGAVELPERERRRQIQEELRRRQQAVDREVVERADFGFRERLTRAETSEVAETADTGALAEAAEAEMLREFDRLEPGLSPLSRGREETLELIDQAQASLPGQSPATALAELAALGQRLEQAQATTLAQAQQSLEMTEDPVERPTVVEELTAQEVFFTGYGALPVGAEATGPIITPDGEISEDEHESGPTLTPYVNPVAGAGTGLLLSFGAVGATQETVEEAQLAETASRVADAIEQEQAFLEEQLREGR